MAKRRYHTTMRLSRSIATLLVALMPFASDVAADDAYLRAIEAETDSLQLDRDGVINQSGAPQPAPAPQAAPAPSASSAGQASAAGGRAGFESALESGSRSLHRFYTKLSDEDKETVYQEYQSNNDIKALRPTIVRLYTAR